jgi:hypothetical protein
MTVPARRRACIARRLALLMAVIASIAQTADVRGIEALAIQLDPFAQATSGFKGCPSSSPPLVTPEQMRIIAHERAERGTYCALEGRCEPGGAYRRDPEVNERVRAAIAQDKRFASTSVAVTTTRRFVTLTGCVHSATQRHALVDLVKAQFGVDRVFDETRVGIAATHPPTSTKP